MKKILRKGMRFLTTAMRALALVTPAANKIPYFTSTTAGGLLDLRDEDDMASDSATSLATQQSIKAYVDGTSLNALLDEDDFATDSATKAPSQQSTKAYIATKAVQNIATTETTLNYTINGETVYSKLIDLGALPNNTTATDAHGITGLLTLYDLKIVADNGTNQICFGGYWTDGTLEARALVNDTNISITTVGNASAYSQAYATLIYSKS